MEFSPVFLLIVFAVVFIAFVSVFLVLAAIIATAVRDFTRNQRPPGRRLTRRRKGLLASDRGISMSNMPEPPAIDLATGLPMVGGVHVPGTASDNYQLQRETGR